MSFLSWMSDKVSAMRSRRAARNEARDRRCYARYADYRVVRLGSGAGPQAIATMIDLSLSGFRVVVHHELQMSDRPVLLLQSPEVTVQLPSHVLRFDQGSGTIAGTFAGLSGRQTECLLSYLRKECFPIIPDRRSGQTGRTGQGYRLGTIRPI